MATLRIEVSCFFVKHIRNSVNSPCLLFLMYILQYRASTPSWIVILLSKFGSNIVSLQSCEISQRVPVICKFVLLLPLLRQIHPFCDTHFPHLCLQVPLAAYFNSLKRQHCQHSHSELFFHSSILVWFEFHCQCSHVSFICYTFILVGFFETLFGLSNYVKRQVNLSLGDKEAIQLHSLLFLCELGNRCAVSAQLPTYFKRIDVICHWSICTCVIYSGICELKR